MADDKQSITMTAATEDTTPASADDASTTSAAAASGTDVSAPTETNDLGKIPLGAPTNEADREQLRGVVMTAFRLGYSFDAIAGALACHQGLSLAQAVAFTEACGRQWSRVLLMSGAGGATLWTPTPDEARDVLSKIPAHPSGEISKNDEVRS
jgi:hypothetical protein